MTAAAVYGRRWGLDALVAQMLEPGFVARYCRMPILRERPGHVSPVVLAQAAPRSRYVRQWRRHAHRCAHCASIFRYFGLHLN